MEERNDSPKTSYLGLQSRTTENGERFVHLHVHSHYTFMRGTASPEALCRRAKALGYDTLALTDTNGFYGLPEFLAAAKRYELHPIIGAHVHAHDAQAVLLAKDTDGYRFISTLLTRLHHNKQSFSLIDALQEHDGPHCMVLSPDIMLLAALKKRNDCFAELRPGAAGFSLYKKAHELQVPVVATAGVYFLKPGERGLHRVLRAIDLNTTLDRIFPDERAPSTAWLKDPAAMAAHFPYAPEALANTQSIAARLHNTWDRGDELFPVWDGKEKSVDTLTERCFAGARKRYGTINSRIRSRLESELDLIGKKGFADYFLIVADIVTRFPITCGRGSAAASLVSYCLGITHVDPLEHNLLFSRFLNEGRSDLPDIDVDFPWDEKDDVTAYVRERFGEARMAAVANVIGFKSRSALREVAKVFGIPNHEIKKMTRKFSGYTPVSGIAARIKGHPLFTGIDLPEPWPEIIRLAASLEGIPRYLGTHCGGIVVTPDDVAHHVPIQISAKGMPLIQWNKDGAEDQGLVKMDLLGNRSLAVIRDTLQAVRKNYGTDLSYQTLNPLQDEATQDVIRQGKTMGVFYVESPAMRRLLKMAVQGDYNHLIALSSIIRPAANRYILEYVRRLRGGSWKPLHPAVEEILAETYGVMVYQEDIACVAMTVAGFSEAEADIFRKILTGRSRASVFEQQERFYRGARKNRVAANVIDVLWEMVASFAGYSFCKPHSASYALVSFKAAYLKTRFPAEFMAAVLSNGGGFYGPRPYLSEAERMGLTILPPDVNESGWEYHGNGNALRVGLMPVKGLSRKCLDTILEERDKQRFSGFADFITRVEPHKADALLLLRAGALDSLGNGLGRIGMAWYIRAYGNNGAVRYVSSRLEGLPCGDLPAETRNAQEVGALGFPVSFHPLQLFQDRIDRLAPQPLAAADLHLYVGKPVTMAGWPIAGKGTHTRKGEPMEFVSLEDETDTFEATFFPAAYKKFCQTISFSGPLVLKGVVEEQYGAVSLRVEGLRSL